MAKLLHYWKTGWMFIAMMMIYLVLLGIVLAPVRFLVRIEVLSQGIGLVVHIVLFLVFAPLIGCWVLNTFDRLGTSKYSILHTDTKESS